MVPATSPLDSLVARAQSLYSLPAVAVEVMELTAAPQVDAEALRRCIERDPALAAKLLRVVNSSLFGLSGKVDNLTQAIALLGTGPLKLLVLGFSLPPKLLHDIDAEVLRTFWRGALTRAVAARQLIQSEWKLPGDEAFLIALLQDLGILVLLGQLATPYARFVAQVRAERHDLIAMEQDALGFDHRDLTVALLRKWNLPALYAESIATRPAATSTVGSKDFSRVMPQVLRLANLLGELVADHRLLVLPDLLEFGHQYCGLDKDRVARLVAELEPQVDELADVLQLDTGGPGGYEVILAQAHQQLALVAEQAAGKWVASEDAMCESILHEWQELRHALETFTNAPTPITPIDEVRQVRADAAQAPPPRGEQTAAVAIHVRTDMQRRVADAARACRTSRAPLSLLYLDVSREDVAPWATEGAADADGKLRSAIDELLTQSGLASEQIVRMAVATWAVIAPGSDRAAAMDLARQAARELAGGPAPQCLKAGVASIACVSKAFEPERLVDAARRCLDAARQAGGTSIKSIEVY